MSNINTFSPVCLRNSGHFQFNTEFRAAVEEATPAALEIAAAWPKYVALYESLRRGAQEDSEAGEAAASSAHNRVSIAQKRFYAFFVTKLSGIKYKWFLAREQAT